MSDDDELTTDNGARPRRRRRPAASASNTGAVETSAAVDTTGAETTQKLWTPPTTGRRSPAGLRVAAAGSTERRTPPPPPPPPVTTTTPRPGAQQPTRGGALPVEIGPSGIDGIPGVYDDGADWLRNGVKRQPWGIALALIFGWTGVWLALWGAAIGILVGVLVAVGVVDTSAFGNEIARLGGGQAVTIVSILGGIFFGAIGGFLAVLRYVLAVTPWEAPVAIASGFVLATIIGVTTADFERLSLRMRGYRRLSRDEVRRVAPLVRDIAEAMALDGLPRFAMDDRVLPNAWSHMRTIVITTGLLQSLDDAELRAVLAHELQHWRSGDSVGLHLVWAAAWPVAVTYDIGMIIAGRRQGESVGNPPASARRLLVIFGWAVSWPAWVILKVVIAPTVAASQRRYEYAADAAAAQLGYAPAMISALRKMTAFEGGRTGWERAMTATHPPTELRIEALQSPKPDDAQYQEDDLRCPRMEEIGRMLRGLVRPPRASRS